VKDGYEAETRGLYAGEEGRNEVAINWCEIMVRRCAESLCVRIPHMGEDSHYNFTHNTVHSY